MLHADLGTDPLALVNRVLCCGEFDDLESRLLGPLSERLRCTSAALVHVTQVVERGELPPAHIVRRGLYVGPLDTAIQKYNEEGFRHDPIFRLPSHRVHCFFMGDAAADGVHPFRQFLQTHHIRETIGLTLPVQTAFGVETFALSFQRSSYVGGFAAAEFELVQTLVPALQAMLNNFVQGDLLDRYGPHAFSVTSPQLQGFGDCGARFRLTERETEVVRMIAHGHDNADAARRLGIRVRTVENHLRAIYSKVGVRSRTQMLAHLFKLS